MRVGTPLTSKCAEVGWVDILLQVSVNGNISEFRINVMRNGDLNYTLWAIIEFMHHMVVRIVLVR
jgi:hypothetical protein